MAGAKVAMPARRHGRRGHVPRRKLDVDDAMRGAKLDRCRRLLRGLREQRSGDMQEEGEQPEQGLAAHALRYTTRPAAR